MESQKMHLRHVTLHCFRKGNSAKDTTGEIFTVYGSGTTTIRTVGNWFKKFRAGNFELKDEDRSGRPATTDTDIIKTVLTENPRYSVREIVDATNIPKTTVRKHLIKIGYANRCEVWVLHLLTETGLMNRVSTCDLLVEADDTIDADKYCNQLDQLKRSDCKCEIFTHLFPLRTFVLLFDTSILGLAYYYVLRILSVVACVTVTLHLVRLNSPNPSNPSPTLIKKIPKLSNLNLNSPNPISIKKKKEPESNPDLDPNYRMEDVRLISSDQSQNLSYVEYHFYKTRIKIITLLGQKNYEPEQFEARTKSSNTANLDHNLNLKQQETEKQAKEKLKKSIITSRIKFKIKHEYSILAVHGIGFSRPRALSRIRNYCVKDSIELPNDSQDINVRQACR
ncbi:Histone-lysine N-methyltransferase SETMAR [Melipona quadrifasciata]|uniref:Histone-lysine N-methyltransferase SETMAR n=1 Tax=Melipona quadrifasciata TaxID=166423 RepID=A0A0N0BJU3_9HYME|nr:Histone-lysine N-methyltransferase SETMAR [Melipona quadrifasciata]